MLGLKRSCKAGRNANSVGLRHNKICHSPRVLAAHAGYHEIDARSSNLGLINGNFTNFVNPQVSELSPRGEFGFDGECDKNSHRFKIQKHRSEACATKTYAAARAMRLARLFA